MMCASKIESKIKSILSITFHAIWGCVYSAYPFLSEKLIRNLDIRIYAGGSFGYNL